MLLGYAILSREKFVPKGMIFSGSLLKWNLIFTKGGDADITAWSA